MRPDPLGYLSSELQTFRGQGLSRRPRVLDGEQEARTSIDGRLVVSLSSNNYLGLTAHTQEGLQFALDAFKAVGTELGVI